MNSVIQTVDVIAIELQAAMELVNKLEDLQMDSKYRAQLKIIKDTLNNDMYDYDHRSQNDVAELDRLSERIGFNFTSLEEVYQHIARDTMANVLDGEYSKVWRTND